MKALVVRQPWAGLIAAGRKTIELRTWKTSYRGTLAICAGANCDPRGAKWCIDEPRGRVVAVVELAGCEVVDDSAEQAACFKPSAFAPVVYGWKFASVLALRDPPKIIGKQGLFTLPEGLVLR